MSTTAQPRTKLLEILDSSKETKKSIETKIGRSDHEDIGCCLLRHLLDKNFGKNKTTGRNGALRRPLRLFIDPKTTFWEGFLAKKKTMGLPTAFFRSQLFF